MSFQWHLLLLMWLTAVSSAMNKYCRGSRLSNGQRLGVRESICSWNGIYSLYLNQTGYLMLKDNAMNMEYYVISSPSVPRPHEVSFNASGVLVAISTLEYAYWSTGASGEYLELQNNGMLQLFSRDSTTGQYVVSWSPGLLPLTTVVSDQKQFFIPGGYRKGLQLRASMKFNEYDALNIAQTLGSDNIAMHIATRFEKGQLEINSLWDGAWQQAQHVKVGGSFVNGEVSEVVFSADQYGFHAYSTRTPNVTYNINLVNLPLEKFKYLWGSQPITVGQVTYGFIAPKVAVTGRAETTTPYTPTLHPYYAGSLPSMEVQGGDAIASTIPPNVAVCSQQSSVVTIVLACLCCFEAVAFGGLLI